MSTVQESLDKANASELPHILNKLKLGTALAALRPRETAFTGLTSGATHVHPYPALIAAVNAAAGTPLAITTSGDAAVAAGHCRIAYDADGVPTLTFEGAVTAYIVHEIAYGDESLADNLESTWTGTT